MIINNGASVLAKVAFAYCEERANEVDYPAIDRLSAYCTMGELLTTEARQTDASYRARVVSSGRSYKPAPLEDIIDKVMQASGKALGRAR